MGALSEKGHEPAQLPQGLRGAHDAHGAFDGQAVGGRRGGGDEAAAGGHLDSRPRVHGLR